LTFLKLARSASPKRASVDAPKKLASKGSRAKRARRARKGPRDAHPCKSVVIPKRFHHAASLNRSAAFKTIREIP